MSIHLLSGLEMNLLLAYIDPGFGSMQFQILVASLLSASFFLKSYCLQARDLIGRFLKRRVA
jgi:hypothetical protein